MTRSSVIRIAMLVAIVLSGCAALLPHEYLIDRTKLEAKMRNSFAADQKLANGLLSASLESPQIAFLTNEDKIALFGRFSASMPYTQSLQGSFTLNASLHYDHGQKAIFLQDLRLTQFSVDPDESLVTLVQPIFDILLSQYAKEHPLYRFKPDELRLLGTEINISAIHVVNDGIKLSLSPAQ